MKRERKKTAVRKKEGKKTAIDRIAKRPACGYTHTINLKTVYHMRGRKARKIKLFQEGFDLVNNVIF